MNKLLQSFGPVCAVIGAQWGDEGKGKVVDVLAEHYDVIARACGGANAGHTIVIGGKKHVFHLLPSGSIHEGKSIFLGSGMVVHLPTLLEEIETLKENGIEVLSRLTISGAAHIVFDFHKEIDSMLEQKRDNGKLGTTKRGIGPAYMDKAERVGLRMGSLKWRKSELQEYVHQRSVEVRRRFDIEVDEDLEVNNICTAKKIVEDCILENGPRFLAEQYTKKKTILIEGAQATLLDLDHGTYPYVTSSATSLAGALQGLGFAAKKVSSCIGVAKAYCTRVGEGNFATEETGAAGERLRTRGGEFGATTGRPRRCGWLDIADLQYASCVNGYTHWNITKLDVLDEEISIPMFTGEEKLILDGWQSSTSGLTKYEDLPPNAKKYIQCIENETGIPVALIGTGQGREEMIIRTSI